MEIIKQEKKRNSLIEYIIKEDNYITNMKLPIIEGKLLNPEEHLFNICIEEGVFKAKEALFLH